MFKRSTIRVCSLWLMYLLSFSPPFSFAQGAQGAQGIKSQKQKNKDKGPSAAPKNPTKSLTEEQKAIHLLDRVTFGPRPDDVERIMKMGWQKYLDEQLHPERIADEAIEEKLKNLETIHLDNRELAQYYPPPQAVREALKSKGLNLPGANQAQTNQAQTNQTQIDSNRPTQSTGGDQMKSDPAGENVISDPAAKNPQSATPQFGAEDFKRRREVAKALAEMGYKPPQSVVQQLQAAKILRAAYSERQLQEVMTDFWFNHFNVYVQKGFDRILTTSYERDVIRPHVFGKFEDLLRQTAESPAMLFYLDNWMSASPNARMTQVRNQDIFRPMRRQLLGGFGRPRIGNPAEINNGRNPNAQLPRENSQQGQLNKNGQVPKRAQRGLNENYAREIMELHTLGVDGGYTQKDVQEVARCLTGWTIRNPRNGGEFFFNPSMHDDGEKVVLGQKIPAGGGKKDGEMVIKILAHHPSTAKFISTKLARKFVSDNPPPSLIDRLSQTFLKSDGDIREVLRTIFNSPEFWAQENYRTKIKTPFEMTVSAVRAIGAETNGNQAFHRWIAQMGEGLFLAQPPTGYPDNSEHWVNTGALLERMNFALALTSNRIPGTRVNLDHLAPGVMPLQPTAAATMEKGGGAPETAQIVDHYAKLLLHGELSSQTRTTIDKTLNEHLIVKSNGNATNLDVAKVIGLILGSPEFQRQ